MTLFLTGVSVGYLKVASVIGYNLAADYYWLLIPLSIVLGLTIIFAEPAIHVLNKKVEDVTNGIIRKKAIMIAIAIGVCLALILAVLRIMFNIPVLYIILPFYLAMLVLTLFSPKIFTAIAFDSGGIAAGAMSTCFILPFVAGISKALGNDAAMSAFGTIGLVATAPILSMLVLGVVYKLIKNRNLIRQRKIRTANVEIVEFDVGVVQ
jgi:hypothetical protein